MNMSSLQALSNNIAEIVEKSGKAIVSLNANRRFSPSGIHWQEGIIVTSDESLKRADDITVTLENGDIKPVLLLGRDPSTDVAVFQIENPEIPVATIGDAANLKVGNLVLALARSSEGDIRHLRKRFTTSANRTPPHPFHGREVGFKAKGSLFAGERSFTFPEMSIRAAMGTISVISGEWKSMSGGNIDKFIRPDISLYPGFSGGALVDVLGNIVGMNTTGRRGTA